MKRNLIHILAELMVLIIFSCSPASAAENMPGHVLREAVRNRIETLQHTGAISIRTAFIHTKISLPRFYETRGFDPVWVIKDELRPEAKTAMDILRRSDEEGLEPNDYHLDLLDIYMEEIDGPKGKKTLAVTPMLVEFDLLLTDAVLLYASHLLAGAVNPETFDKEWHANRRRADLAEILQQALTSGNLKETIANLAPQSIGYTRLKTALRTYRDMAASNSWPVVPPGPKLHIGDSGNRVKLLKKGLVATWDLPEPANPVEELFDEPTESALKRFQRRHGLETDGTAGPATLAALNVSPAERMQQIKLNLERWRWLPSSLGERYILVNIPDFRLDVIENCQSRLNMRVVVGKSYRRTPVFSDHLTYIVLNPRWEVPFNIAVEDKLPLIKKDPEYLKKMHMCVFRGWGSEAEEIDPSTVSWKDLNKRNFPYRLRQSPGPWNALGQIKFMFPNKFNVYLHGTPEQHLFLKEARSFSSGCIRLENPLDLLVYFLKCDPKLSRESIQRLLSTNIERTVRLPESVPVHLLYWTAWVSEDEKMQFRPDVYGRDKLLAKALSEKPLPVY